MIPLDYYDNHTTPSLLLCNIIHHFPQQTNNSTLNMSTNQSTTAPPNNNISSSSNTNASSSSLFSSSLQIPSMGTTSVGGYFSTFMKQVESTVSEAGKTMNELGKTMDQIGKSSNEQMKAAVNKGNDLLNVAAKQVSTLPDLDSLQQTISSKVPIITSVAVSTTTVKEIKRGANTVPSNLDLTYITNRIISMGYPVDPKQKLSANDYARFLNSRHGQNYIVWDLSEQPYDASSFPSRVTHIFPGHPSPPLHMLFKISTSIENWLNADSQNVAIIHCATGKGRTATMIACLLAWIGEQSSPTEALQFICEQRGYGEDIDGLTIPSQRRYVQYFGWVLDGIKPQSEALRLKSIVIQPIPNVASAKESEGGIRPIIQIYTDGQLLYSSNIYDDPDPNEKKELVDERIKQVKFYKFGTQSTDNSIVFEADTIVEGDILVRCRHVSSSTGKCASVFRAAFHTGYVPSGVLRLNASKLDGACMDHRFVDLEDFHVDLVFGPTAASSGTAQAAEKPLSEVLNDKFWVDIQMRKEQREKAAVVKKANDSSKNKLESNPFTISDDDLHKKAEDEAKKKIKEENDDLKKELMELTSQMDTPLSPTIKPASAKSTTTSSPKKSGQQTITESSDITLSPSTAAIPSSAGNGAASTSTAVATDNLLDFDLLPSSPKTKEPTSTTIAPAQPPASSKKNDVLLDELEDLEKELVSSKKTASKSKKAASSPKKIATDDDLSELEQYLTGMNTSGKS